MYMLIIQEIPLKDTALKKKKRTWCKFKILCYRNYTAMSLLLCFTNLCSYAAHTWVVYKHWYMVQGRITPGALKIEQQTHKRRKFPLEN